MSAEAKDRLRRVESLLVTQLTTPNNQAPYDRLTEKYGIRIDYRPFTEVRPLPAREFRKQKINLDDFSAIIFTSKNSVDHFFKMCDELRYKVTEELKYFCTSETIALYLQKHVIYRKRKVFFGKNTLAELKPLLVKHRKKERYLIPCSNAGTGAYVPILGADITYQEADMFQTASSDLSDLENVFYDMLVFFSPLSIHALYDNFPEFKQNNTRIAVFGNTTAKAASEKGLILDIEAPTVEVPSMTLAIDLYLKEVNNGILVTNPQPKIITSITTEEPNINPEEKTGKVE